ncbi:hypothetical protein N431DRAFT_560249 [Stipitochalara longipes BDJ]|nr:hypothetical protein N431DRAFT_560249 [Stipitochalara longipes BDJ]
MMDSESENEPPPWDFRPVRRFLRAFDSEPQTPPNPSVPDPLLYNPKSTVPNGLGDFDRLFSYCGKSLEVPPPKSHRRSNDSSTTRSTGTTPPSSAPDDDVAGEAEHFDKHTSKSNVKEVRWKDQLGRNLTEVRRRSAHGLVGDFDAAVIARLIEDDGYESDTELSGLQGPPAPSSVIGSRDRPSRSPTSNRRNASTAFLPASVAPTQRSPLSRLPPPIPAIHLDPSIIQPFYTWTVNEQKAKLVKKLLRKFPEESPDISNSISRLGNKNDDGIHIFVDCSNIVIGFYNQLRHNRNINPAAYVRQPPISYHSLALILERGRRVARRVLVGSNPRLRASERHLLNHVQEAQAWGYEVSMLERVEKLKRSTPRRKKHGSGNGYATTSGQSSGSETPFAGVSVVAEQGVDEILQMKLLESLVDTHDPSTIVLASGDAAEAEFSGGFLKCVERALSNGWKVEVIAWGDGLSREYRSRCFAERWTGRFKVIELDDFCEEMLALYISKHSLVP